MSRKSVSISEAPSEPAAGGQDANVPQPAAGSDQAEVQQPAGKMAELAGMLNNHKGKLAAGAAAMLGVAIFYKWRENRLAKEDPEEYARLKRLKKAIGSDPGETQPEQPQATDTDKPA